jgi:SAM-dependent methyltransferase
MSNKTEEVLLMQPTSWLFDELSHAGEEHLDPDYVAAYDRKAQTDPSDDLARLQTLGLDHTTTLVDFGAGTGTFALAAAAVCRRVVAVDVSAPMLEQLRQRAKARRLANVETVQSGFLTYRHRGEPADFAHSRNALHHLPDFWKGVALHQVAAMLRPGGIFFLRDLVYSFDPGDATEIIEAWLAGAPRRPEEGYTAADLATHVRTEYSTYTWLQEPLLERAGFEVRDVAYPSQVFAAYTCVKR